MSDSFVRFGKTNTFLAFVDKVGCKSQIPLCDACTVLASGNTVIGPFCNGIKF